MKKSLIASFIVIFSFVTCFMGIGHADASTSRVGIITKWEGTVEVQKSGGKKNFKAFKNMSLNQGDIVTTGKDSSVVLQFSNGTTSDDTLTLEENSTVTFTKLKNKSGTTTKVRMKKGKAWVDVKSIQNKDDEFTLETPTAIMGVRGTNFFIGVDPETGASMMAVFAGIVTVNDNRATDAEEESFPQQQVYPSMIFNQLEDYVSTRTITNADSLDGIMGSSSEAVIRQLLENANKIQRENESFINGLPPSSFPVDLEGLELSLEDYYYNIDHVIEFILGAFVEKKYITAERIQAIINELIEAGTDNKIEFKEPDFRETQRTKEAFEREKEKLKQLAEIEKQKKNMEAAAKSKADELKKLAEQKRLELLEMEKKRREAAEAAYLAKLAVAERAAFEANKKAKEQESQSPQPTPTPDNSYTPSPTPAPAPDWGNESTPFVVYQLVDGEEVSLDYFREGVGYFIGAASILLDGESNIYIPASGKYEVTEVIANQVTIGKTSGQYNIPLSSQIGDELILSVKVRDQASNSSYTYQVHYRVEQMPPPSPEDEFELYAVLFDQQQGLPEEELISTQYIGGEIPTYRADALDPEGMSHFKLEIPNASSVVINNGEPDDSGDGIYNIELNPSLEEYSIRVTTIDQREYIIEIPLQLWWKDIIPFELYEGPDMVGKIEMEVQEGVIVASVELGEEFPQLFLQASNNTDYTIFGVEAALGDEAYAYELDAGVFELFFNSEVREVVYEVNIMNNKQQMHQYTLEIELTGHWMDDSFLLYVGDEPVSYVKTNWLEKYFYLLTQTDQPLKIRASDDFEIMNVMVIGGYQGQGQPIERNPDGYYGFEIPDPQHFYVDIYIYGDGRGEGIIRLEIEVDPSA